MSDIRSRVQSLNPDTQSRDLKKFVSQSGNIYQAIVMMSKRANEVSVEIRNELRDKLQEFAVSSDTIEEVQENKEQIEISKLYERIPNSAIIAINEYLTGKLSVMESPLVDTEEGRRIEEETKVEDNTETKEAEAEQKKEVKAEAKAEQKKEVKKVQKKNATK